MFSSHWSDVELPTAFPFESKIFCSEFCSHFREAFNVKMGKKFFKTLSSMEILSFFLSSTLKASLGRGEGLDVLREALLHTEAASVSLVTHYKDLIISTSSSPQTSQVMTWSNPWQAHDWSAALVEMSLCQMSISAAVSLRMQCTVNYQKSISATFLCTFLISLYSIVNCIF